MNFFVTLHRISRLSRSSRQGHGVGKMLEQLSKVGFGL
jgi:hypothetical protein